MCFDCLNLCVRFLDTHLHNLSKVRILMIPARTAIPPDRLSNHETKLILGQFACPIGNKAVAAIILRDHKKLVFLGNFRHVVEADLAVDCLINANGRSVQVSKFFRDLLVFTPGRDEMVWVGQVLMA